MNVHHLELFYFVARHGGIMEAVRNIPYGIQQPAVSGQIAQLEEYLGVALFHRRPFSLTPAGKELYEFILPFFDNLTPMAEKLRGGVEQHLRIAASEIVLRDYLPSILEELSKQFPKLKVSLREAYDPEVIPWLQRQEIDVSVGLLGAKPPPGVQSLPIFKMPLVLLVAKRSKLKSADELWTLDRITDTLITVPSNQPICRAFQEGLARLKVDWFSGIEVSSVEMVQTYVAKGYGIGVTVGIPRMTYHPQVRPVPLDGFDSLTFGALWHGRRTVLVDALLKEIQKSARLLADDQDAAVLPLD